MLHIPELMLICAERTPAALDSPGTAVPLGQCLQLGEQLLQSKENRINSSKPREQMLCAPCKHCRVPAHTMGTPLAPFCQDILRTVIMALPPACPLSHRVPLSRVSKGFTHILQGPGPSRPPKPTVRPTSTGHHLLMPPHSLSNHQF